MNNHVTQTKSLDYTFKKSITELKVSIIIYIEELIKLCPEYRKELYYYLDYYNNVFSNNHFYKITKQILYSRDNIEKRIDINLYDPIFEPINKSNDFHILEKIWKLISDKTIFFIYYDHFLDICLNFCIDNIYEKLPEKQGYVIKYDKLDQLISKKVI